jgi:ABC-type branched-subunit amino acid transport system permease subunit
MDKKKNLSSENIIAGMIFLLAYLLPLTVNAYQINIYTYFMTTILLCLSLTLIWGMTGIFSFAQASFFGIGAYAYGVFGQIFGTSALTLPALLIAVLVATLVAGILGLFMFYGGVNDVFVGLITLCFAIAFHTFMMQTAGPEWAICGIELGGWNGLYQIPQISIFGYQMSDIAFYLFVLSIVLIVFLAMKRIQKTKIGYSLLAVRENRSRSELLGYNVPLIQTLVFAVGGGIAGLAGVLYSSWGTYVSPSNITITASTLPVVIVAAGGRKNCTAAMIFSGAYCLLTNSLASSSTGSQYSSIVTGIVLILVVLYLPEGLICSLFKGIDRLMVRLPALMKNRRKEVSK